MKHHGTVIKGLQNGRKFGFPTANIALDEETNLAVGVYAAWVETSTKKYKAMLYVGTRPTLNLNNISIEIHLLDFKGDLYGKRLSFDIATKIRDEEKFKSTEKLIAQLRLDRKAVRAALADPRRRLARREDIPAIMSILDQGRRRLKALHVNQWQEGYPNEEAILNDIANKQGHVFILHGQIVAYAAFVFERDPYYEHINGKWLSENPYVVVHRIAVCDQYSHLGIAKHILHCAEKTAFKKDVHAFRIDTHLDNHYMRNLIRSAGFTLCGIVQVRDGKRLAYEKEISL